LGNTSFIKDNKEKLLILVLVIAPFVYLLPYVLPLNISGYDISVGNDFRILYYNYKVYLLHFLSRLEIPYWSPSEASGYPFYSNPFTQFFYPLNIPLALFYKLAGGYSSVDHHRFTVLAFSLLSVGIYKWLRTMKIDSVSAFISAFLVTSSIGSLEILRFPNAIHTLCWIPWILFSINKVFLSERKLSYLKYSILLFICAVCAITAGYPYYLYYALFIFVPYFAFFVFRYTRLNFLKCEKENIVIPVVTVLLSLVLVLSVCYPYLKSVSELMAQTNGRGGDNYEYSTASSETPLSTLGSLIYPPLSSVNTSFYLGLTNLFVMLLYFVNKSKTEVTNKDRMKWVLFLWIVLLVYITYASGSLLFDFLWKYLPFFSSLREWGRLNKIILILFAWLLGLAYSDLFKRIKNQNLYSKTSRIVLISVSSVIVLFTIVSSSFKFASTEWMSFFVNSKVEMFQQFSPNYTDILKTVLSGYGYVFSVFAVLMFFAILKYYKGEKILILSGRLNAVIIFIIAFSFLESYAFAPWLWIKAEKSKKRETLVIDNNSAFTSPRTFNYKTVSLINNYSTGIVADWYYKSYVRFLDNYGSDTLNINRLLGLNDGKKLFFTAGINHTDIASFLADSDTSFAEIKLINYSGNSLEVTVNNKSDGYLNFIDNWDAQWNATVNGNSENILKMFNTFKTVRITKGVNNVAFYFKPY